MRQRALLAFCLTTLLIVMVFATACGETTVPAATNGAGSKASNVTNAAAPTTPATPTEIRLGLMTGTQTFPIQAMQEAGLDKKYGFKLSITPLSNPAAINNAMQTKAVDISFVGWSEVQLLRQKGVPIRAIAPLIGYGGNDILVPKDSPIQTIADLKGKKIGSYAPPGSTATLLLRMICLKEANFDPVKDGQVTSTAAPLLVGLLQQHQVDAALVLDPFTDQLLASGDYRSIGNLRTVWSQLTGQDPLLVSIAAQDDFLQEHPDAVKAFLNAYRDAVQYLQTNTDIWTSLAANLNVKDKAAVDLLRSRLKDQYLVSWDAQYIARQEAYNEAVNQLMGSGFMPTSTPADSYTLDYLPH